MHLVTKNVISVACTGKELSRGQMSKATMLAPCLLGTWAFSASLGNASPQKLTNSQSLKAV